MLTAHCFSREVTIYSFQLEKHEKSCAIGTEMKMPRCMLGPFLEVQLQQKQKAGGLPALRPFTNKSRNSCFR